jgi:uncharacterized protein YneF (UPF0154 family)
MLGIIIAVVILIIIIGGYLLYRKHDYLGKNQKMDTNF